MYVKRLAHSRCSISNSKWMWVPRSTGSLPDGLPVERWPCITSLADLWDFLTLLNVSMAATWAQPESVGPLLCQSLPPSTPSPSAGLGGSQPDAKEGSRAEKALIPCSIKGMAAQCHLLSISHPVPSAEDWLGASHYRAALAVHKFPSHSWLGHLPAMAVIYHVICQSLYPDPCSWPQV